MSKKPFINPTKPLKAKNKELRKALKASKKMERELRKRVAELEWIISDLKILLDAFQQKMRKIMLKRYKNNPAMYDKVFL
ncbi:MAG: hypothetical protein ACLQQ4_00985 [Bacteroidia bacterium]